MVSSFLLQWSMRRSTDCTQNTRCQLFSFLLSHVAQPQRGVRGSLSFRYNRVNHNRRMKLSSSIPILRVQHHRCSDNFLELFCISNQYRPRLQVTLPRAFIPTRYESFLALSLLSASKQSFTELKRGSGGLTCPSFDRDDFLPTDGPLYTTPPLKPRGPQ